MAASAKLQLLIDLKNKLGAGLNSAKRQVEKATGDMQGKLDKFSMNMTKSFAALKEEIPMLGRALDIIKNPLIGLAAGAVAVGTGFVKSVQMANEWNKSMAEINVTAEQTPEGLKNLSDSLLEIGSRNANDLEEIPKAFSAIIGAIGNTEKSLETLEPVLRAAKAGFVDVETAAKAATNIMGSAGVSGQVALDTIIASVKEGNAGFADVANYLPKIIPMAKGVGISLGEVSGAFAQMTKAMSVRDATTSLQGITRALSSQKVAIGELDKKTGKYVSGFKSLGIEIFDNEGKIRSLVDIATDLNTKMEGLTDKQKMLQFDKLGLDQSATLGIMSMMQNVEELGNSINAVSNSTGALDKAFADAKTPMDDWLIVWNSIKTIGIKIGNTVLPVISAIGTGVKFVIDNLDIIGGTLAGLGIGWALLNTQLIASKVALTGFAIASKVATAAQWLFNIAANANPIGVIVMAITALIGGLVAAYNKFDKFRAVIKGVWETIKGFGMVIKQYVIDRIKGITSGLGAMGSAIANLFKGNFSEALEDAKKGIRDLSGIDAAKNATAGTKNLKNNFKNGYNQEMEASAKKNAEEQESDFTGVSDPDDDDNSNPSPAVPTGGNPDDDARAIKGGSQTKNTTINIGTMSNIEQYSPKSQEINNMNKTEFERYMTELFMRVVRSGELTI